MLPIEMPTIPGAEVNQIDRTIPFFYCRLLARLSYSEKTLTKENHIPSKRSVLLRGYHSWGVWQGVRFVDSRSRVFQTLEFIYSFIYLCLP